MKLSEAMRKGMIGNQHARGDFICYSKSNTYEAPTCMVCAFGAALIGSLGEEKALKTVNDLKTYTTLLGEFPIINQDVVIPFHSPFEKADLWNVVLALNDRHGWDFDKIVEWVESVENGQA